MLCATSTKAYRIFVRIREKQRKKERESHTAAKHGVAVRVFVRWRRPHGWTDHVPRNRCPCVSTPSAS